MIAFLIVLGVVLLLLWLVQKTLELQNRLEQMERGMELKITVARDAITRAIQVLEEEGKDGHG